MSDNPQNIAQRMAELLRQLVADGVQPSPTSLALAAVATALAELDAQVAAALADGDQAAQRLATAVLQCQQHVVGIETTINSQVHRLAAVMARADNLEQRLQILERAGGCTLSATNKQGTCTATKEDPTK